MKREHLRELLFFALMLYYLHSGIKLAVNFNLVVLQFNTSGLTSYFPFFSAWFMTILDIATSIALLLPLTRRLGLYGSFFSIIIKVVALSSGWVTYGLNYYNNIDGLQRIDIYSISCFALVAGTTGFLIFHKKRAFLKFGVVSPS